MVQKSGLPYFLITEKEQTGCNFGERYTKALQFVYDQGYDNVISIGNDTPQLKMHHLVEAAKQLEQNKTVLGPSKDGGFYLLGLQKSQFKKAQFVALPWQTKHVFESLKAILSVNHGISYLTKLRDINSLSDVKILLDGFKNIPVSVFKILIGLFNSEKRMLFKKQTFTPAFQPDVYFNKGSPVWL